jgi:hypothetical protein
LFLEFKQREGLKNTVNRDLSGETGRVMQRERIEDHRVGAKQSLT